MTTTSPCAYYSRAAVKSPSLADSLSSFSRRPAADILRRHPRGLPVLVYEASRRAWGLRLRRTVHRLALSPLLMLPSAHLYCVGVRVVSFRSSIAHPAYTPVYASLCPSR